MEGKIMLNVLSEMSWFHGSKFQFDQFNQHSWFSNIPDIPHCHIINKSDSRSGFFYEVLLVVNNPFIVERHQYNNTYIDFNPGNEDYDIIDNIFNMGYDSVLWMDTIDTEVNIPSSIIYVKNNKINIKKCKYIEL